MHKASFSHRTQLRYRLIYLLYLCTKLHSFYLLSLVSSAPSSLTFVSLYSHAFPLDYYNSLQICFGPNLTLYFDFLTLSFSSMVHVQPYYSTCTSLNMMQSSEQVSAFAIFSLVLSSAPFIKLIFFL